MSNQGIHDTQIIQKVFTGRRTSTPAMGCNPLQATVVSATATTVTVTVDNFSDTATFTALYEPRFQLPTVGMGSAPSNIPPRGTSCLIVFVLNSVNPWVMSFSGWPVGTDYPIVDSDP
jgi:hypothetical protein